MGVAGEGVDIGWGVLVGGWRLWMVCQGGDGMDGGEGIIGDSWQASKTSALTIYLWLSGFAWHTRTRERRRDA